RILSPVAGLGVFLKKSLFGESIHALDSVREISELKESLCPLVSVLCGKASLWAYNLILIIVI
ncbi:MAG: hypothetical protein M1507_06940, partial [Candidatus Thermoplasmatota archaeon]|nr:hypothetical protein [Candidatus Thermoplasmatota archaeon]